VVTTSRPTALQDDRQSTACKSQHAADGHKQHCSIINKAQRSHSTWHTLTSLLCF